LQRLLRCTGLHVRVRPWIRPPESAFKGERVEFNALQISIGVKLQAGFD
jgi:hypothetical protein